MFGHIYCIKIKIILCCILIVTPILRIVSSNYKISVYNNVWNLLAHKLKHKQQTLKRAPWDWPSLKAETCRRSS